MNDPQEQSGAQDMKDDITFIRKITRWTAHLADVQTHTLDSTNFNNTNTDLERYEPKHEYCMGW